MNIEPATQTAKRVAAKVEDFRATADDLFADPPWGNEMPWWKSPLEASQAQRPDGLVIRWTDLADKARPGVSFKRPTDSTYSQLDVIATEGRVLLRTAHGPKKFVSDAGYRTQHKSNKSVTYDTVEAEMSNPRVGSTLSELLDVVRRSGLQDGPRTPGVAPVIPGVRAYAGFLDPGDAAASLWFDSPGALAQVFHLKKMTDQQPLLDVLHAARRVARVVEQSAAGAAKQPGA